MTPPTPAQIEAAKDREIEHLKQWGKQYVVRVAELERLLADKDRQASPVGSYLKNSPRPEPYDPITQPGDPRFDGAEASAAAQVGEQPINQRDLSRYIQSIGRTIEDATIERCVQKIRDILKDEYGAERLDQIAAAIRKLKEEK